jgi:hypothetical protein
MSVLLDQRVNRQLQCRYLNVLLVEASDELVVGAPWLTTTLEVRSNPTGEGFKMSRRWLSLERKNDVVIVQGNLTFICIPVWD